MIIAKADTLREPNPKSPRLRGLFGLRINAEVYAEICVDSDADPWLPQQAVAPPSTTIA